MYWSSTEAEQGHHLPPARPASCHSSSPSFWAAGLPEEWAAAPPSPCGSGSAEQKGKTAPPPVCQRVRTKTEHHANWPCPELQDTRWVNSFILGQRRQPPRANICKHPQGTRTSAHVPPSERTDSSTQTSPYGEPAEANAFGEREDPSVLDRGILRKTVKGQSCRGGLSSCLCPPRPLLLLRRPRV